MGILTIDIYLNSVIICIITLVDFISEGHTHLRDLCATFGDNNWPESLHLGDIIEKHLADHQV